MRRALILAALACLVPASSAHAASDAKVVAQWSLPDRGVDLTIATTAFTAPTHVQVYLPAGYDADPKRRWPVTYYLHGANGDSTRFHAWYGDQIKDFPSIVVAPSGGTIGFYSDWYNGGKGGPPEYETYDMDQLIPLIDARFRTTASRAGRALIGESMGGFGVMTYAARHPDLFATSVSMSGAVDSNFFGAIGLLSAGPPLQGGQPDAIYGPRATQEIRWHGHNPTDLAGNLRDVDLQVRTAEGYPDPAIEAPGPGTGTDCTLEQGIFQMTTAFHARLDALGIPHLWKDYGAGCHTIPNFRREFADALPGIERDFAHPRPDPTTFDYRSIEPHFTIWGWRVDADPARALEFLSLDHAGRAGVTLAGSGTTTVTTPAFFRGLRAVDVLSAAATEVLAPDRDGRLRFTVDLGRAHPGQEQNDAPPAGYFTRRGVTFAPHARLAIRAPRHGRVCVRSVGPAVRRVRLTVLDAHRRRLATAAGRCVRLPRHGRLVRATGTDAFEHRVATSRRV